MPTTDPNDTRFSRRKLLVGGGAACVGGVVGAPEVIRWVRSENTIRVVETAVRYDPPPHASGVDSLTEYSSNEAEAPVGELEVDEQPLYVVKDGIPSLRDGRETLRVHGSTDDKTASTLLSADKAVRTLDNSIVTPGGNDSVVVGGQQSSVLPTRIVGSGLRVVNAITSVEERRHPQLDISFDSVLSVMISNGDTPPDEGPDGEITDPEPGERVTVALDPISVSVATGPERSQQDGGRQIATIEAQPTVIVRDLGTLTVVDGR